MSRMNWNYSKSHGSAGACNKDILHQDSMVACDPKLQTCTVCQTVACLRVLQQQHQQRFCRSSTVCVLSVSRLRNTSVSQSDCSTDVGLTGFQLLWCDAGVSRFHVCLSTLADDGGCRGLDLICGAQRKQAGRGEPSQPDIQRTEL